MACMLNFIQFLNMFNLFVKCVFVYFGWQLGVYCCHKLWFSCCISSDTLNMFKKTHNIICGN